MKTLLLALLGALCIFAQPSVTVQKVSVAALKNLGLPFAPNTTDQIIIYVADIAKDAPAVRVTVTGQHAGEAFAFADVAKSGDGTAMAVFSVDDVGAYAVEIVTVEELKPATSITIPINQ